MHKPGKDNTFSDATSRNPSKLDDDAVLDDTILNKICTCDKDFDTMEIELAALASENVCIIT